MRALGIDGCRGGWVGVLARESGVVAVECAPRLEGLLEDLRPDVVGVDMPIGLVETGWRACDVAARELLAGRRSTVFLVPPRRAVEARDYAEASALCRELTGKGLSRQAFALAPRILEVDALVGRVPGLFEVHPEVSFQTLSGASLPKKKGWSGARRRLELLERAGLVIPTASGSAGDVPVDDVLDAGAAAWTALRLARGEAQRVGDDDRQLRRDGEPIAIWS